MPNVNRDPLDGVRVCAFDAYGTLFDLGTRFRRVAKRELIFRAATLRVAARRCSRFPTMVANDAVL
jgi:hypothetical protein